MSDEYGKIFVGGGFYGAFLALGTARDAGERVLLLERQPMLLEGASYRNQARVHNGYHYPRSVVTGARSRINFPIFCDEFADCVEDGFEKYYAIARSFSNVNARQFRLFCERIGAPVKPAPDRIRRLFNPALIEDVFRVEEVAFDARRLRDRLVRSLREHGVDVRTGVEVTRARSSGDRVEVECFEGGSAEPAVIAARDVYNCTYSRTNQLLHRSGLPTIPLKHEWTEIALVRLPDELRSLGVTVMCGPFFSVMPFPPRGLHSLSHVRYTPHAEWRDSAAGPYREPDEIIGDLSRETRFPFMIKDAVRYLPSIAGAEYVESLWEIKTVLPKNDVDDGRPILLKRNHGLPHLHCVMGSKIDNAYDVLDAIRAPEPAV